MEAVLDYSKILDTVPCGICQVLLDTDLTMLYANQFYYKIYGYTPQSAKSKRDFQMPSLYFPNQISSHTKGSVSAYPEWGQGVSAGVPLRTQLRKLRGCWSGVFYDQETAGPHDLCSVTLPTGRRWRKNCASAAKRAGLPISLHNKLMYIYDAEKNSSISQKPRQMNLAFRRLWMMPLTAS